MVDQRVEVEGRVAGCQLGNPPRHRLSHDAATIGSGLILPLP
jgi:hypothetical protein